MSKLEDVFGSAAKLVAEEAPDVIDLVDEASEAEVRAALVAMLVGAQVTVGKLRGLPLIEVFAELLEQGAALRDYVERRQGAAH